MSFLSRPPAPSKVLPARLTAFGICYCALHVGTVFLRPTFPPGLTLGDWVSLLIPWVVMGSAMLVWDATPAAVAPPSATARLFLASALLYATGYGITLAANAIGRLVPELAPVQPSQLIYFLDEHLGHILWHLGMVGVTVALLLAAQDMRAVPLTLGPVLGAAAYAFAWFTDAVEGQTVPLLLPASLLLVMWLWKGWISGKGSLVRTTFLLAHALALGLFGVWGFWQRGFPQFSDIWGI